MGEHSKSLSDIEDRIFALRAKIHPGETFGILTQIGGALHDEATRAAELRAALDTATRERDEARAEVERLRARPTVHPLAWAYLQEIATRGCALLDKTSGSLGPLTALQARWEAWWTERCPLTATGVEVLVPEGEGGGDGS